ncbi:MAG: sugar transferase, partial [Rikenellaceae bacterium]
SPFLLIIVLAIRIESRGPIIYKSKRVGSNYRVFDFLKFRSMYTGADKRLKHLDKLNMYSTYDTESLDISSITDDTYDDIIASKDVVLVSDDFTVGEQQYLDQKDIKKENTFVKLENDPRVTKVGKFMRKYSIDELPQLINVVKGDMSIVGNRPLPLYEAELLTADDYIDRFMAPSGLTGLWQVEKHGDNSSLSSEERKLLDLKYAKEFSFAMDMKIIFGTFAALIQKENI